MAVPRGRVGVSLSVIALVAAACGSSQAAEPVQPATRQSLIDLYNLPVEFVWAEMRATADCMGEKGFRYPPFEVFQPDARPQRNLAGLPFRLSRTEAQQVGYGSRIGSLPASVHDLDVAVAAYLATLTSDQQLAYSHAEVDDASPEVTVNLPDGLVVGAASKGCIAEGRIAVYGSVTDFLTLEYLPQGLRQFSEAAFQSEAFKDAQEQYGACMRDAGYDVATLTDAVDLAQERFATRLTTDAPTGEEMAMAVTDAECQAGSKIYETVDDALVVAASSWINDHEGEVLGLAEIQRATAERAKAILGASS